MLKGPEKKKKKKKKNRKTNTRQELKQIATKNQPQSNKN